MYSKNCGIVLFKSDDDYIPINKHYNNMLKKYGFKNIKGKDLEHLKKVIGEGNLKIVETEEQFKEFNNLYRETQHYEIVHDSDAKEWYGFFKGKKGEKITPNIYATTHRDLVHMMLETVCKKFV